MGQEQKKAGQYRCDVCGQTFNSEREHREHHDKIHKGRPRGQDQPSRVQGESQRQHGE